MMRAALALKVIRQDVIDPAIAIHGRGHYGD
jgi:hypothetical protein